MTEVARQILLLLAEATVLAGVLVLVMLARRQLGLPVLYLTVGVLQLQQTQLAASLYINLAPGFALSPGSAVLFTGTLFAVLLVHIREGPSEARRLIYGLFVANLSLSLLNSLFSLHFGSPLVENTLNFPIEIYQRSTWLIVTGSGLLLMDVLLIVALYEELGRLLRPRILRIYATLAVVLVFDAVLFYAFTFGGSPRFTSLLWAAIIGKLIAAVIYAIALHIYLQLRPVERPQVGFRPMLRFLTYREELDELVYQLEHDALTGVHSRRYLNRQLAMTLEDAMDMGADVAVLMIDIDDFKHINDRHGHPEGDRVLVAVATTTEHVVRPSDDVCRYGGDELVVVMPGANVHAASEVAERIRRTIEAGDHEMAGLTVPGPITVSIGVAHFPGDAVDGEGLIRWADRRLYRAKESGRNRVVAAG